MAKEAEPSPPNGDDQSEPSILHIGSVFLGSSNVSVQRREDFRVALRQVIDLALEQEVDVVIQTGSLWGTRSPSDEDPEILRDELTKLQEAGIRFIAAGSERDLDMEINDELADAGLIERPYEEPAKIGSTAILAMRPNTRRQQFREVGTSGLDATDRVIVAAPFTVQPPDFDNGEYTLEHLPSEFLDAVDDLLVGEEDTMSSSYFDDEGVPTVYVAGPTEQLWRMNISLDYPCQVGFYTPDEERYIEIDRDPFVIYYINVGEDTELSEVQAALDLDDRTTVIRLQGQQQSGAFTEEEITEWLESECDLLKLRDKRKATYRFDEEELVDGVEVTTKYQHDETNSTSPTTMIPDDPTDIDKIEKYLCGQSENSNDSTCQECFSKKLFGGPGSEDRDTQEGDLLLLYDCGNKGIPGNDDKYVYGPFIADSGVKNIDPDAWGGRFPNQVEVSWEQLYRLPSDEIPVSMGGDNVITGDAAGETLNMLIEEGRKIRITKNGERKKIDEPGGSKGGDEPQEPNNKGPDPGGIRDIVELREMSEPLPIIEDVKKDANPGAAMLRPAVSGESRPELYREALTHLIAGKNLIFYGPPGSGKTRIAERLSEALCSKLHIETANAEWTNQDVVGGYHPEADGFKPTPGLLTTAAADCENSLSEIDPGHPTWLLIDELNRANLDEAFGEVFTLLDLSYRSTADLTYADGMEQTVPLAFRIIGTMNSEDQAQLFALGYAFRRRFAFVEVPPVYDLPDQQTPSVSVESVELEEEFEKTGALISQATVDSFDHEPAVGNDSPFAIPYLEEVFEMDDDPSSVVAEEFDEALQSISPPDAELSFDRALLGFVQKLDTEGVATIGQGILIDAYKYVVTHYMLYPEESGWETVDQAVVSYILPQIESYMVDLRRSGTVASDSDAEAAFESVIEKASEIGLHQTESRLEEALETHEIIG